MLIWFRRCRLSLATVFRNGFGPQLALVSVARLGTRVDRLRGYAGTVTLRFS